jgi:hypothetical protein
MQSYLRNILTPSRIPQRNQQIGITIKHQFCVSREEVKGGISVCTTLKEPSVEEADGEVGM